MHCRQYLPSYMIPHRIIVMKALPMNANNQINSKKLPVVDFNDDQSTTSLEEHEKPMNYIESVIHELWCSLFGRTSISIEANFFMLGGTSLLFMRLVTEYRKKIKALHLNITKLISQPTMCGHFQLINATRSPIHEWQPRSITQG